MNTPVSDLISPKWLGIAAVAAVVAGALAAGTMAALGLGALPASLVAILTAAAAGGCCLVFAALSRKLAALGGLVEEQARQSIAWENVRPLLGPLPVNIGGWAADPLFAERVAMTVLRERPRLVVECGSGLSTVVVASCLRLLGDGTVVSLDHDPPFAEETRRQLALRGVDGHATVVTAPLADVTCDGTRFPWYDFDPASLTGEIDLLIVDGPPAGVLDRARYPAVPLLRHLLAPHCIILMDDGDRPGETRIAREWAHQLGARLEHLPGGKGGWRLTRSPGGPAASRSRPAGQEAAV